MALTVLPTGLGQVRELVFARHEDERGSFVRTWCRTSFAEAGFDFSPDQSSLSYNPAPCTLRGMHYQAGYCAEAKLVRCINGAVYDVALDVAPGSPDFGRWVARTLSAERGNALFIPRGFAHGFLSLSPGAVVEYLIEGPYTPAAAAGYRWDDPAFAIAWPSRPEVLSERDQAWPLHG